MFVFVGVIVCHRVCLGRPSSGTGRPSAPLPRLSMAAWAIQLRNYRGPGPKEPHRSRLLYYQELWIPCCCVRGKESRNSDPLSPTHHLHGWMDRGAGGAQHWPRGLKVVPGLPLLVLITHGLPDRPNPYLFCSFHPCEHWRCDFAGPRTAVPWRPHRCRGPSIARWGGTGEMGRRKGTTAHGRVSSRSHETTQPHADRRRARCCRCARPGIPGTVRGLK